LGFLFLRILFFIHPGFAKDRQSVERIPRMPGVTVREFVGFGKLLCWRRTVLRNRRQKKRIAVCIP